MKRWRWPVPRLKMSDGARLQLWPVRIGLCPRLQRFHIGWHAWHVCDEHVPEDETQFGYMPGWRGVFGQTVHLGFFQIRLGDK